MRPASDSQSQQYNRTNKHDNSFLSIQHASAFLKGNSYTSLKFDQSINMQYQCLDLKSWLCHCSSKLYIKVINVHNVDQTRRPFFPRRRNQYTNAVNNARTFDERTKPMIHGEELFAQQLFLHIKLSIITGVKSDIFVSQKLTLFLYSRTHPHLQQRKV